MENEVNEWDEINEIAKENNIMNKQSINFINPNEIIEYLNDPAKTSLTLDYIYNKIIDQTLDFQTFSSFNIIEKIFDLTNESNANEITTKSFNILYLLTKINHFQENLIHRIYLFCIERLSDIESQFLLAIYALLFSLLRIDRYRNIFIQNNELIDTILSQIQDANEPYLHKLYLILTIIVSKPISKELALSICNSISNLQYSSDWITIIFYLQMQYSDIILNFDSSVILGEITELMKRETVSESLIAVNLLSLLIHSDIEFDFDFAPLIDLAELKDTKLESAALFCLSELVLKNSEILNQCLERNIIQIAESKANSPSIVQKESIRLLSAFICGMTRTQMENYISVVSMKILLQGLDYDDTELLKLVIQAMDCIFRPKCGEFFKLFYNLFLECDGWSSINSMMCNYDDHTIHFLSTAFYHNYSDIESLNEE